MFGINNVTATVARTNPSSPTLPHKHIKATSITSMSAKQADFYVKSLIMGATKNISNRKQLEDIFAKGNVRIKYECNQYRILVKHNEQESNGIMPFNVPCDPMFYPVYEYSQKSETTLDFLPVLNTKNTLYKTLLPQNELAKLYKIIPDVKPSICPFQKYAWANPHTFESNPFIPETMKALLRNQYGTSNHSYD